MDWKFLDWKEQRVSINGGVSSWADVHSSIPQGSVLGPILFIIFINDLPDVDKNCVKIFADDTKVFIHVQSDDDCRSLQRDLEKLSEWSDTWQHRFNVSKCGVMHYGNQDRNFTYSMSEENTRRDLDILEEEKDLRVKFDPTLCFTKHVAMVSSKANRMVDIIRRTFDYMDEKLLKTLYKTLIRPHLEYANCIWNPPLNKDLQMIEKIKDLPPSQFLVYESYRMRRDWESWSYLL